MNRFAIALPLIAALGIAACSDGVDPQDSTELEGPTTDGEAAALANAVEPGDFMDLQLGAKIVGPQGPTPSGAMTNAEGAFADITSYVACPAGMDPCDPKTAPAGTVYTYVHTIYPGEDNDPTTGSGSGNDSSDVERAEYFRLTAPAHGFTGAAGYSKLEAQAAAGLSVDVVITCDMVDGGGALVWTVNAGDGGDQWAQAEPLTFYWQTTLPPAGPATNYAIRANAAVATGPGPYPAAKEGVRNACDAA